MGSCEALNCYFLKNGACRRDNLRARFAGKRVPTEDECIKRTSKRRGKVYRNDNEPVDAVSKTPIPTSSHH